MFYMIHFFKQGFIFNKLGYGATLAWLMFAVALVITVMLFGSGPLLGTLCGGFKIMSTFTKSTADVYQLRRRQETITALLVTSVAIMILLIYLMPMGYALVTSLKSKAQTSEVNAPILPSTPRQFEYDGETYDIMLVPQEDGTIAEWGLVQARRRGASDFIDPANPEAGIIQWEGNWRTLEKAWEPNVQWENYPDAWNFIRFGRLLMNTLGYALVTMVGMVSASALTPMASLASASLARISYS